MKTQTSLDKGLLITYPLQKTINHLIFPIVLIFLIPLQVFGQAPEGYTLIWSDEFSGNSLDESKWKIRRGGWNASNVQNCYVPENVAIADGSLQLTAKHTPNYTCGDNAGNEFSRDFTSGFVETLGKANWTFGYFEARVKVPASNSTWPAFWMSPEEKEYGTWPASGEIDIFEIKGHDMTSTYGNAIWGNSITDRTDRKQAYEIQDADAWHVYGLEWQIGVLKFYIDGNLYHTIHHFDEPNAGTHPQPFDIPYYLRLNIAVGGTYLQAPFDDAHNGIDQLPATMEVDWVRVYEKTTTSAPDIKPLRTPSLVVFPNPVGDRPITIQCYIPELRKGKLLLSNAIGSVFLAQAIHGTGTQQISLSDLPSGIYWVQLLVEGEGSRFSRFVKY